LPEISEAGLTDLLNQKKTHNLEKIDANHIGEASVAGRKKK